MDALTNFDDAAFGLDEAERELLALARAEEWDRLIALALARKFPVGLRPGLTEMVRLALESNYLDLIALAAREALDLERELDARAVAAAQADPARAATAFSRSVCEVASTWQQPGHGGAAE